MGPFFLIVCTEYVAWVDLSSSITLYLGNNFFL